MERNELLARVLLLAGGLLVFLVGVLLADVSQVGGPGRASTQTFPTFDLYDWGRMVLAGIALALWAIPSRGFWVTSVFGLAWASVGYVPARQCYEHPFVPNGAGPD